MTRAMMIESKTPKSFWPEALATSTYLVNRLPTKILDLQTPLEALSSVAQIPLPLTLQPRVFGCSVFVHIPKHERNKLSPCAIKCVFVGYGVGQKGYRCYEPKSKRMFTTMNCDFLESEYFYNHLSGQGESESSASNNIGKSNDNDPLSWLPMPSPPQVDLTEDVSGSTETAPLVQPAVTNVDAQEVSTPNLISTVSLSDEGSAPDMIISVPESNTEASDTEEEERRDREAGPSGSVEVDGDTGRYVLPVRANRGVPPKKYTPEKGGRKARYAIANCVQSHLSEMAKAFEATLYEEEEIPHSVEEAMRHKHWREAMKKEMEALARNNTWEKCILPEGKKPVGCRWVFTIKRRPDGSIERYKARLVAKGYTQTYGVDYSETFSPVAKMDTVRVLLSIAANKDWPLHQFDVTNAFLHGELKKEEEVYMESPPGFSSEYGNNEVCRLKKTLYGLKQSPRVWFGRFSSAMESYGFKQSISDHTLFLKRRGEKITCLIIYVDDMIITGDDVEEIEELKKNLFQEFDMKDLAI